MREAVINAIVHNDYTREVRVFKDLEMVEHLGSGIPRITRFFGPECFHFTENFLRASLPSHGPVHAEMEVTDPVTDPIDRLLQTLVKGPLSPSELQQKLALKQQTQQPVAKIPPHRKREGIVEMSEMENIASVEGSEKRVKNNMRRSFRTRNCAWQYSQGVALG